MNKLYNIRYTLIFLALAGITLVAVGLYRTHQIRQTDHIINNPFSFTILKNYSDDFASIGTILNNTSECPLQKENIADPSFCMIRTVTYDGLRVRVFSFDAVQSGTAEYVVTDDAVQLINGLTTGAAKKQVRSELGKPFKVMDDKDIYRSSDVHNFLVFFYLKDQVSMIRWHEEREPSYKDTIVWQTQY